MAKDSDIQDAPGKFIKAKVGRDGWMMRGFIAMIAIYLIIALALPLYTMLSKAFSTYNFDLTQFEFQVSNPAGEFDEKIQTAQELNNQSGVYSGADLLTDSGGRLGVAKLFPKFSFRSPVRYKIRGTSPKAIYLIGSERHGGREWPAGGYRPQDHEAAEEDAGLRGQRHGQGELRHAQGVHEAHGSPAHS